MSGDQSSSDDESKILARNRKRVAPIDESSLTEEEAKALEQRRAYNRKCAAKARKRSKDLIVTLQAQVEELTKEKSELQRNNEVMRAQMDLLEQQNRTLLMSQRQAPVEQTAASSQLLLAQTLQGLPILEAIANQARLMASGSSQALGTAVPKGVVGDETVTLPHNTTNALTSEVSPIAHSTAQRAPATQK